MHSIVIMGVAGCGKTSLANCVAAATGLTLVEGDDHHSQTSRTKMAQGTALTDADRDGWLNTLSALLRAHPKGVVLSCSALKRAYRDRLRQAAPGLRFAFLDVSPTEAQARVLARADSHFFSSTLIDSQFATLENPCSEAGVLRLDALAPLTELQVQVTDWLTTKEML